MRKIFAVVMVAALAAPAMASLLGLPNDVPGTFDNDPIGTLQPAEWDSYEGDLDGVTAGDAFGPPSPQGGNKYGAVASYGTKNGMIDIWVPNPEPDEWTKTIGISGWVYAHSFDGSGAPADSAYVRFSLHMDPSPLLPTGLDLYSDYYETDDFWTRAEWIVEDVPCQDFNVNVELEQRWAVAWNVTYVDDIDVEHICVVPEPTMMGLVGVAGLLFLKRRRG